MPRFTPAPQLLSGEVEGELVLLDPRSCEYYSLNRSATRIWKLLQDGTGAEEVARRMAAEHGLAADEALADVRQLVEQLIESGLLSHHS